MAETHAECDYCERYTDCYQFMGNTGSTMLCKDWYCLASSGQIQV